MAMTSAPSCANRTASARPWPRAAPVMKTTWPSKRTAPDGLDMWFPFRGSLRDPTAIYGGDPMVGAPGLSPRSTSDDAGEVAWRWWKPAFVFLAIGAVVWLVTFVAAETLPRDYLYPRLNHPP